MANQCEEKLCHLSKEGYVTTENHARQENEIGFYLLPQPDRISKKPYADPDLVCYGKNCATPTNFDIIFMMMVIVIGD